MPNSFSEILGQQSAIDYLKDAYCADRMPHALIFAGPAGVGKGTAAAALGKLWLCDKPNIKTAEPCRKCDSCRTLEVGTHPDFHVVYRQLIRLEKESSKAKELPVDVIRLHLIHPAGLKPAMNRGKVFVIEEAELMTPAAQNALLKTLEEPPGRTIVVLLTDQPDALLPTIRSRAQLVRFGALPEELVVEQLRKRGIDARTAQQAATLSEGSLGTALKWIRDGVVSAAGELMQQLDAMIAGQPAGNLQEWFKKVADAYGEKQLERDELASKDQATREGLALYLRLSANRFRRLLTDSTEADDQERAAAGIDVIVRAEQYLDGNVNIPLVFQQLVVGLEQLFLPARTR
jgi:DNA polymerase-3 subunit delta'